MYLYAKRLSKIPGNVTTSLRWCSVCGGRPTHIVTFPRLVTAGGLGRYKTLVQQDRCQKHAESFAKGAGIAMPSDKGSTSKEE